MDAFTTVRKGAAELASLVKGISWFISSLMGEDAYEKYREHHVSTHGNEPAMTERQFWRDRYDRQDRNPEGRCC
ncbi:MAG: hypothetical protein JWP30_1826 [Homoserinimonas sp.]|jgi:uncharacterized short protein YbdD (DUF466 family)|nr:hypothetical protein [Homoserinimonas sp.]